MKREAFILLLEALRAQNLPQDVRCPEVVTLCLLSGCSHAIHMRFPVLDVPPVRLVQVGPDCVQHQGRQVITYEQRDCQALARRFAEAGAVYGK